RLSELNMRMQIDYPYLESIARQAAVGQSFEEDGKRVEITSVHISGQYGKLVVEAGIKGSITGNLIISGIPEFDKVTKILKINSVDFKYKSDRILEQAAAWLLKGRIRKEMDKLL